MKTLKQRIEQISDFDLCGLLDYGQSNITFPQVRSDLENLAVQKIESEEIDELELFFKKNLNPEGYMDSWMKNHIQRKIDIENGELCEDCDCHVDNCECTWCDDCGEKHDYCEC